MRSPELISDENKQKNFVYHPNPAAEGYFHSLVASPIADKATREQAWKTLASTFGALESPEAVKSFIGQNFYDFANWLAKNAREVSDGTQTIPENFSGVAQLSNSQLVTIWDNLFYQLIANKSSYVRDLVINVLIANHYVKSGPSEGRNKLVLSRVVIPQEFYGTASLPATAAPVTQPVYTRELQVQIDRVVATEKVEQISVLTEELKNAQQAYNQKTSLQYEAARNEYDLDCSFRRRQSQVDNTADQKPVDVPAVDVQPFSFIPSSEMSQQDVSAHLSAQSLLLAAKLNLFAQPDFNAAFAYLADELKKQTTLSFDDEKASSQVVKINNALLPVGQVLPLPGQQYTYVIQMVPFTASSTYKIVVAINMGYPNADAVYATYSAATSNGNNTNGTFIDSASGNYMIVQLFPNGFSIPAGTAAFGLTGEIRLANGDILTFNTQVSVTAGASGRMTLSAATPEPGTNGDYVPLGFGIKRLGIADYRKVEQTTCCYVPGEVSHIENIMAKEYKEKSTRRLRRSEETITTEKQTEKEQLTDTTSTDRYEMNQQASEVISKDFSTSLSASTNMKIPFMGDTSLNSNFAYHTSTQNSNSQAVSLAKDVTERAMERVVQKVREERILKVIEEFEEQNKHGFDNRKGTNHVSGIYRWVDKIYNNQVYNYGKRLMYEFMVPQPAVFHAEAMKNVVQGTTVQVLQKPIDPRTAGLPDYRSVNEPLAAKWAAAFNAAIESPVEEYITISKAYEMNTTDAPGWNFTGAKSFKMDLPDDYETTGVRVGATFHFHPDKDEWSHTNIRVGEAWFSLWAYNNLNQAVSFANPVRKELAISAEVRDLGGLTINVMANCHRTAEAYTKWQVSTFAAIIKAYEDKLADYNDAVASAQVDAGSKGTNPGFYRIIENTVLRKNCMTYLVGDYNLGQKFYSGSTVDTLLPDITETMDRYAARAKFMEQAFEWELLSYSFYPFYWGNRAAWQSMYQADVDDPLFRSFLQAGLARVIVTVRPGFEEAVMHYMATGQVWNGGQVPVVGDELYLSIVEELKNPAYYVDDTWETRVPTTLSVIQAGSIGLNTQGLPCECGGDDQNNIVQLQTTMLGENDPTGPGGAGYPVFPGELPMAPSGVAPLE
ncbi:hypothetical protein GCM10027043_33610 [Ferruginibacter profundus]